MNTELLLRIKEHILAEPRRLLMEDVVFRGIPGEFICDGGLHFRLADCGTAACIAGWACILNNESPSLGRAKRILDLDNAELFFVLSWPSKLYTRWRHAKTPQERAVIAAERIDYFIEKSM